MATLIVKHPITSDSNLLTPPFLPLLLLFLCLSSPKSTSNWIVDYMHFFNVVTLVVKHPFPSDKGFVQPNLRTLPFFFSLSLSSSPFLHALYAFLYYGHPNYNSVSFEQQTLPLQKLTTLVILYQVLNSLAWSP